MPKKPIPRLLSVAPGKAALSLVVSWERSGERLIDVSGLVETFRALAPLARSADLFAQVRLGEYGTDVAWPGDIEISADTLWRLAQEQAGVTMSAAAFKLWRERKAYSLDSAARSLGLSRRMIAYYEQGEKPIPRLVALATKALEDAR